MSETEYPLGTDRTELDRLFFQHQLWSDVAHAAWLAMGIGPGSRVLDIGCGPGAASVDLAHLVGTPGRVLAVDESPGFIEHLTREAARRGLSQIEPSRCDVQKLASSGDSCGGARTFDAAYARWVLCFTPKPEEVVRGVAALLAPGGRFCVHDYFNYESLTTAPRRSSYARFVAATAQSWRDTGGDPDVVARLPRLLDEHGFSLDRVQVHQRLARPGDPMWHWASTWWRSYGPKLLERGYVSEAELRQFEADQAAMTRAHDFLALPPVYEVIATRLS